MRCEGDRSILTIPEVRWAWQKLCEGHKCAQVAEALNVHYSTVKRNLTRVYGRPSPSEKEMIPLVYKEE